jgi:DNA modification methylase
MLTKNSRYYYNAEAAREPSIYKRQHNSQRRRAGAPPLQRADKNLTDVWMFAAESHISEHPATFPRELVERCLRISCPRGGHVLESLGMASTMIDLKAEYCEFAEQRISATSDPDQTFEAAAN